LSNLLKKKENQSRATIQSRGQHPVTFSRSADSQLRSSCGLSQVRGKKNKVM